MLQTFLTWWIARLAELLPARLRRKGDLLPDAVLVKVTNSGRVAFARRRQGVLTPIPGEGPPPGGLPQCLVLPPGYLLERRVDLPLAVAREANRVVALDFDRLTPFRAEDTIWGLLKTGEDAARGMAHFTLGLIPKVRLEPEFAALRREGLQPATVECSRPGSAPWRLALAGARHQNLAAIALAAGLILLALVAVASPFIRQEIELARIEAQIAAVTPAANVANRLLRRLSPGQQGADRLVSAQAEIPRALRTLAAVTAALPDDTNLVSLSLQDNRLEMEGTSDSAAKLIGLLAAHPPIQDPNFSSPVTRTMDGKDAFTLSATVAGPVSTTPDAQAADNQSAGASP